MRKYVILLMLTVLLCGCAAEETFETVADDLVLPVMASPREITVRLPENAVAPVLEQEGQQLYLCDGYEILMETKPAGNVGATMRGISGYEKEALTVMETQWQDVTRYEFVWTCAGERGEQLGRGIVLDDGNYHYCLSVLRNAEKADKSQINWNQVFQSFQLV